ncbi:MAG: hypothetical protein PX481_19020 [Microcystis sp. M53603_WE2]|jgi:hypothetical protein|uniref:Uncharacterized protein n=1 Tax=Microcystis aeruginosa PCC 9717 TaxID=1160286 RepID=I4FTH1_MICAE|nr:MULTISPECIES: hypothetical protein [Microcystis]MCZ8024229.1 hypothetical protein [Microcystis sp. LE19-10.1B]MDJ0540723.1 hypothetical protein [Microcystis sp. M53603_WE2]MDJ0604704.1 hypothetical protein [Microcystis sp. M53602_WE12]CCH98946.1 conserved hypothetical protein [Microcystis aeruginosa PCC 9717]
MLAELAAAEIAKIAFEAVIGKLTEGAMDKGVELWKKIKQKLQKEPAAAQVLAAAKQTKSEAMIEQQVVPFLQVEMLKDTNFAQEIQTLAQQIIAFLIHKRYIPDPEQLNQQRFKCAAQMREPL